MKAAEAQELLDYLETRENLLIRSQKDYIKSLRKLLARNGELSDTHRILLSRLKDHVSS